MQTTPEQREEMMRRHLDGYTYAQIAQQMQIKQLTVRYWCRQQRQGKSSHTHWSRGKVGILSQFAPELAATILALRQASGCRRVRRRGGCCIATPSTAGPSGCGLSR